MFVYDNSTNHSCYPPGALGLLPGVNKGPGGMNSPGAVLAGEEGAAPWAPKSYRPKMVDGWHLADGGATRVPQSMHEPDTAGNPLVGEPPTVPGRFRGTEAILRERGHFGGGGAGAKGGLQAENRRRTPGGAVLLQTPARRRAGLQGSAHSSGGAPRRLRYQAFVPRCFAVPNHIFWFMG